jgi:flagellar hook-associated protein 2
VTLNLVGAYPGVQVQVSVAADPTQSAQAISSFVSAYNAVVGDLNQQFTLDPSTNSEGVLASDSSLRTLQSSLLSDITYASGSGAFSNLASLGITMNDDGTLSVNSGQLNNALSSDPAAVLNFFQNSAQTGFANNFAKDLRDLTAPTSGVLNMDLAQNRTQQGDLSNSLLEMQDRIAGEQKQLQTQYSAVNALLQSFPYQLAAVQLELGITPSGSNSSGK